MRERLALPSQSSASGERRRRREREAEGRERELGFSTKKGLGETLHTNLYSGVLERLRKGFYWLKLVVEGYFRYLGKIVGLLTSIRGKYVKRVHIL